MLNVLSVLGVLAMEPAVPVQRPSATVQTPAPVPARTPVPAETPVPVETPATDDASTIVDGPAAPSDDLAAQPAAPPPTAAAEDVPANAATAIAMPIPAVEPPAPEPVVLDFDRDERDLRRATSVLAGGAVLATLGSLMALGALTEARKAPCKFDLETCPNAPRPNVTRGLAAGAIVGIVGGGALVAVGLVKRRRIRARIDADLRSAGIVVAGRF
jgi:hypothetical protein